MIVHIGINHIHLIMSLIMLVGILVWFRFMRALAASCLSLTGLAVFSCSLDALSCCSLDVLRAFKTGMTGMSALCDCYTWLSSASIRNGLSSILMTLYASNQIDYSTDYSTDKFNHITVSDVAFSSMVFILFPACQHERNEPGDDEQRRTADNLP